MNPMTVRQADRFSIGMSMKKLKGKFRMSTTSITSEIDVDEWNKYDDRLLDCLYRSDIPKLKETLKKKGVSPIKISRDGQTAMHIAVRKNMSDCVDCFLNERPDLSTTDSQGRTVFHIAASNGDTTMLNKILTYSRWNLGHLDGNNMTPLHCAIKNGHIDCVNILLEHKSPLEIKDTEQRTPLLLAVSLGHENIATTLIQHGSDVNAKDSKMRTPLSLACRQGMSKVAALLLSKGAEKDVKDTDGKSLETIASEAGHSDIVELLQNTPIIHPPTEETPSSPDDEIDGEIHTTPIRTSSEETPTIDEKINGEKHITPTRSRSLTPNGEVFHDDFINGKEELISEHTTRRKSCIQNAYPFNASCLLNTHTHVNNPEAFASGLLSASINSSKRLSSSGSKYNEENSFTTSIIESLMGFDVSSDTISEVSATEDQLHMKLEDDHKALENEIQTRDKKIETMDHEIQSLRNKLKLETEMRFAAEKEVLSVKSQRDVLMENIENLSHNDVSFNSSENHLPADDTVEEIDIEIPNEDSTEVNNQNENNMESENPESDNKEDADEDDEDEKEEELNRSHDRVHFNTAAAVESDSDESVSRFTGYRKRSLGTAKQHIDMLEEHILSLEEDLAKKDNELSDLEEKLQNTKELVDLNNNTTVSLELFNELKNEKITDRTSFKQEIRVLEQKVNKLEEMGEIIKAEKDSLNDKLVNESESSQELRHQVENLETQVKTLQQQILDNNHTCEETIQCYRKNIVDLYENKLDTKLQEILTRIIKLRS